MSDYIMSPGAELYVGPHGRPYESMGATSSRKKPCCDDCGSGKKKCGGGALGALPPVRQAGPSLLVPSANPDASTVGMQPSTGLFGLPEWVLPVAAVGAGVFVIVKLLKQRSAPRSNPRRRRRR